MFFGSLFGLQFFNSYFVFVRASCFSASCFVLYSKSILPAAVSIEFFVSLRNSSPSLLCFTFSSLSPFHILQFTSPYRAFSLSYRFSFLLFLTRSFSHIHFPSLFSLLPLLFLFFLPLLPFPLPGLESFKAGVPQDILFVLLFSSLAT